MYSKYTKEQVMQFVKQHGSDIIEAITNTGLFFPAVVAQLTVESKFGDSDLSARYNNYGGIKATGSTFSTGKISLDTSEVVAGRRIPTKQDFATYADFKKFMSDYMRVLRLPQYVNAGVYAAADPIAQILAIARGGYSTENPAQYLSYAQGRVEACIDNFPWGKINSAAPAPAISLQPQNNGALIVSMAMATVKNAIGF